MKRIFSILFAFVLALAIAMVPGQTDRVAAATSTVLVDNLQPSWTAPGGGGVYSLYVGPPDYDWVSPGNTSVYLGREAGIIKAGLVEPPGNITTWDEGLFGFKPTCTINELAASTLTYDVVNQEGTNPVWMTIEIDTGVPGDRSDNTAYQHVPTTNPASWHTVDSTAGLWQKWNDNSGNTTGNPLISLSDVAANHTGLDVVRAYLRLGMGDSYHGSGNGTIGWVDKVTIEEVTYDFVVPKYWYVATTGSDSNEGTEASPFLAIQHAVGAASTGDTIHVAAGTYAEVSQTIIDKDLNIIGANKDTTIIKRDTGFTGNYFFRVNSGEFNLSGATLDGEGNLYGGVRYAAGTSTGTIDNNIIKNIVAPSYTGFGVVAYGDDVVVSNNIFTNIGRVGVWVGGDNGLVTGNTYTGKGAIDCLDYGIEVGYGGTATITDNTITNCLGVASSDGSTSAAILVTTYYGAGTTATITGNTLTGNTGGIGVGYDESDTSTVVAHYNNIYGNTDYGIDTTAPVVDARYNWWGDASGPYPVGTGDTVSDGVNFTPWLNQGVTSTVSDDKVDAKAQAGTEVLVNGNATVTVFRYPANPGGDPPSNFGSLGKYIDVYVPDTSQVTQIEIRLYYTDDDLGSVDEKYEKNLRLRWWNGTEWAQCSDSGVNTATINGYSGYMWAKIRADTLPSLADLQGTGFDGGYEGPTQPPQGLCAIATAAYGTGTAKEIDILREFRDAVLLPNSLGAKFVSFYYKTSPPIANFISQHEVLRTAVRVGFVDPIVKILNWTHNLWSARGS